MKPRRLFFHALALPLALARRHRPRVECDDPRILIIRRNRMGDMICTLPLLQALRRSFPHAHIAVACDPAGFPIARCCSAVDQVLLLEPGWSRWQALFQNAWTLQDYDWVIAAKAGFDLRLAILARLTNAARRIGYGTNPASAFYTEPLAIPADLAQMHQIEATLGLLAPLEAELPPDPAADLALKLPAFALDFARAMRKKEPLSRARRLGLINLSSTTRIRFSDEDFAGLLAQLSAEPDLAVGIVGLAEDQVRAQRLAAATPDMAIAIPTPGPLELAALLGQASFFITSEGGAAHLAAAMRTPTVVLWSEGPFDKWYSRGADHAFVRLESGETMLPRARVWKALQRYL